MSYQANPQVAAAVKDLSVLLSGLNPSDQKFAASLISFHHSRGYLSDKQTPYVYKLLEKATTIQPELKATVGDMAGIVGLFAKAKQKLKYPKITLNVNDQPLTLWVQGDKAKFPGAVAVKFAGEWAGRIHQDGDFKYTPRFDGDTNKAAVVGLLTEFAANPAEVAGKYGRLGSTCCFCHKPLKDAKSLAVGYGKTCAENWDLPYGNATLEIADITH